MIDKYEADKAQTAEKHETEKSQLTERHEMQMKNLREEMESRQKTMEHQERMNQLEVKEKEVRLKALEVKLETERRDHLRELQKKDEQLATEENNRRELSRQVQELQETLEQRDLVIEGNLIYGFLNFTKNIPCVFLY